MARYSTAHHRWEFAPRSTADAEIHALMAELKISEIAARILHHRGFKTPPGAEAFMSRRMDLLHDPAKLPDIEKAVARIAEAIEKKQHIVLFGDYDADGVTATALLARFFEFLCTKPHLRMTYDAMVPERKNGYGLAAQAVKDILARKPALVITLDNGISAVAAIDALNAARMFTVLSSTIINLVTNCRARLQWSIRSGETRAIRIRSQNSAAPA